MSLKDAKFDYIKGSPVDLKSTVGNGKNVIIVELWATWCGPCRSTIPHLTDIAKKFEKNGVIFFGVTEEAKSKAQSFVTQMGAKMDYRVVSDMGDFSQELMGTYGVRGIPHAFIIGKDGKIGWHGHPATPEFETEIQKAVNVADKVDLINPKNMSADELHKTGVKELKAWLKSKNIDFTGATEKHELLELIQKNL